MDGGGAAPEEVYCALAPAVLGYFRARGDRDPEDLVGDVFVEVARDLRRFAGVDDPVAVRRWVFTIARHRAIDAARRAHRHREVAVAAVPDAGGAGADLGGSDRELVAGLAALTPNQREVVVLRFVADLSIDDVAAHMKRSVEAVKALQHRALENLRKAVSPRGATTL